MRHEEFDDTDASDEDAKRDSEAKKEFKYVHGSAEILCRKALLTKLQSSNHVLPGFPNPKYKLKIEKETNVEKVQEKLYFEMTEIQATYKCRFLTIVKEETDENIDFDDPLTYTDDAKQAASALYFACYSSDDQRDEKVKELSNKPKLATLINKLNEEFEKGTRYLGLVWFTVSQLLLNIHENQQKQQSEPLKSNCVFYIYMYLYLCLPLMRSPEKTKALHAFKMDYIGDLYVTSKYVASEFVLNSNILKRMESHVLCVDTLSLIHI
eukprot:TRINITY_DN8055_c0_g1_i1.p1 TRINITY_DN8055_c0_g1~~TRINITY_DN8055_c0_g1_i1.p1  ORF type:complete len:267 (-),score=23.67 TRINITY_DN8055_c0_g1_i1:60-860(-)